MNELNSECLKEGYWEHYFHGFPSGRIWEKGNYINGKEIGYWEYYYPNGKLRTKEFYL